MKKIVLCLTLLLVGCANVTSIDSTSFLDAESQSIVSSSNVDTSLSSGNIDYSSSNTKSDVSSKSSHTSSKDEESSSYNTSEHYNPDGSKTQPIPQCEVSDWGQTEKTYDFVDSFPEEFSYIYGHQILKNPTFYANEGGWKITIPNSSARMGFQTPRFNTDLKIEMRLYIGSINNSNNKIDEDNPFMLIYGFDAKGNLIRTIEIENQTNFYNYKNSSNPLNFYINGENLSYLEVRFTAAPYKGSQCYNFGIKKIGFKTFPYAIKE